jgi:hypothetical protein
MKRTLLALFLLAGSLHAQTWQKVANENDTVTLSGPATVQFGVTTANAATCNGVRWIEGVYGLPANAPVVSIASTFVASNGVFGADPCPNVVKELDVLETSSAQSLTVNGAPVTVPALPVVVVTPPVTPAACGTSTLGTSTGPITLTTASIAIPAQTVTATVAKGATSVKVTIPAQTLPPLTVTIPQGYTFSCSGPVTALVCKVVQQ